VANLELRLKDYEKVSEHLDKVFAQMAVQDSEWQAVYAKTVMSSEQGPKKLMSLTHVLQRLEQKIREVTLLRKEIAGLKAAKEQADHDREVAQQSLAGGPQPMRNLVDMISEREDLLKEANRTKKRMEEDYHVLFKENQDLRSVPAAHPANRHA